MDFNFIKQKYKYSKIISKSTDIFKNGKLIWTTVGLVGVLIIIFFVVLSQLTAPLNTKNGEKIFIIKEGEGLEMIAEQLESQNIIRNKWGFVFHVLLHGQSKNLQAGNYQLSSTMSVNEIVAKIVEGDVVPQGIKVTIPEGFSNRQIQERLLNLGIIGKDDKLPQKTEGYLFPDTYYFEKGSSIEEIVKKMQDNFFKRIGEEISKDLLADSSMKLPNAVTMASILEKEVKSDEDRAIVAGIFWKRIENNYPLESCATIAYILGVDKWRYSYEDTRIKSPYNTYINIGLPPTPINNPGISAIKAALYPKETDYNFFLTDPETGKTIFSKTLEEHNANKAKYLN